MREIPFWNRVYIYAITPENTSIIDGVRTTNIGEGEKILISQDFVDTFGLDNYEGTAMELSHKLISRVRERKENGYDRFKYQTKPNNKALNKVVPCLNKWGSNTVVQIV